ncbi:MAG: NAD(P)H-hydrate dehydratase [Synergistes sp.]|nr:NAD(P)H-hydrate dehydratase [Synergistes sp.]
MFLKESNSYFLPEAVRRADKTAAEKFSVPSVILMENAAANAAREVTAFAPDALRFVILAGHGNNGGDGFALARHLAHTDGCKDIVVIKTRDDISYSGDAAVNLSILRAMQCNCSKKSSPTLKIYDSHELADEDITKLIVNADIVIDALLGTGASGAPHGQVARLITLSDAAKKIIAMDIPSGIDPSYGKVYTPHINADMTVTFLVPKRGMAFCPAKNACGKVVTANIGLPAEYLLTNEDCLQIFCADDARKVIPTIRSDIHKTMRGNLLIFSGSERYRGAPLLAARGALRAGCGLVYLAVPDFIAENVFIALPEAIVIPIQTNSHGDIDSLSAIKEISALLPNFTAAAAGPGCGRSAETGKIFKWLWEECSKPLLLDADMLWFYAQNADVITPREDVLITPHSAEAARILGLTAAQVNEDRLSAAVRLREKAGTALLKGRDTLVTSKDKLRLIGSGSSALAVPGSGDVLTGVAGAFMASGMEIADAAAAAAFIHGSAGEALEERFGRRGSLASEIADEIPLQLKKLGY